MSNLALVMVKRYQRAAEYIRFIDGDAANYAIKLLRKQPYVNYAIRMTDEPQSKSDIIKSIADELGITVIDVPLAEPCHLTYLLSQ